VYLHANTHKNGTSELESYKKIDEVNYSAIAELFTNGLIFKCTRFIG
jgi:hypothetical protein